MKQLRLVFLFLLPTQVIYSQTDSIRKNYLQTDFPELHYPLDITSGKSFLFSDSIFRKPFYRDTPSSVILAVPLKSQGLSHLTTKNEFPALFPIYSIEQSETFLFYHLGSSNTQYLQLKHVQRINTRLSAVAQYNRDKSDGFYVHQAGKAEQIDLQLSYINSMNTYSLLPYFHYKNQIQEENGGIRSDSVFSSGDFTSPLFLETHSLTAQNEHSNLSGGIAQIFTSRPKVIQVKSDLGFHLQKRIFTYTPTEGMYDSIYYDSTQTKDIYETQRFYHELTFRKAFPKFVPKIGVRSEYLTYQQQQFDTTSLENKIFINSDIIIKQSLLNFSVEYIVTGFNQSNFSAHLQFNRRNHPLFSHLKTTHFFIYKNPDIFYSRMTGNHFQWNLQLDKITQLNNQLDLKTKYGNFKILHELINNYSYLNENKSVTQSIESLQWIQGAYSFELEKKRIIWKSDLMYQKVLSGENFFRLPELIVRSDFRYKTKLKALQMQIGVTAHYRTAYFANAYDPALGVFYLQNDISTGNYPLLDFYILSHVKTVDFKLTLSHFNSGFTGYQYYTTPLYPMAPRAFHFSVSWHFID